MSLTLILVLVVIGAYLAAHVVFEWLGRRYLVVSGAEYLLLGVLLGPEVSGLIEASEVGGFAPLMSLALGWIGAVIGAQFLIPGLIRIPGRFFHSAFVEAIVTLGLVGVVMAVAFARLFGATLEAVALPALTLGAVATVSAPAGIALATLRLGRHDPAVRQLEVATAVDAVVAIVAFGLLLSVVNAAPAVTPRAPTATEWAVIGVAIGLIGGALFHLFLGGERKIDRLFIGLAGAVILVSGAAAYLRLSPLLPALLVGAILINTSRNRQAIKEVLARVERPLYFVLLIFAGAAWSPGGPATALVVLCFIGARIAAKLTGGAAGALSAGNISELGAGWGRALLGQGGLAVAIALNYSLLEDAPFAAAVFTAALVSVVISDIGSAHLARSVLGPLMGRRRARRRAEITRGGAAAGEA